METRASLRGVRLSAQKGRLVADLVRGKPVGQALNILAFSPTKGAGIIKKVLESAIANAEHNDASIAKELPMFHEPLILDVRNGVYGALAQSGNFPNGWIETEKAGGSLVAPEVEHQYNIVVDESIKQETANLDGRHVVFPDLARRRSGT